MLQTHESARARQRPSATHVDSRNPFRRYKREEVHAVRAPKVKKNRTLRKLKASWKKFLRYESDPWDREELRYQKALDLVKSRRYSAKDVEFFSFMLADFQNETSFVPRAGLFLSALINNGADSDYVIHTHHLDEKPDYLGFRNTKNILVKGDVASYLGYGMQDGSIEVVGSTGQSVGIHMENGKITVRGNTGIWLGSSMTGGEIIVDGNTGTYVAHDISNSTIIVNGNVAGGFFWYMENSEVHIGGDLEIMHRSDMRSIRSGKIFHRGVQIYPKPEREN